MEYLRIKQAITDQRSELENVYRTEKIIPRENLEDYDVRVREFKSLVRAAKELGCAELLVITSERIGTEDYRGKSIKLVPLWQWLLEGKKLQP